MRKFLVLGLTLLLCLNLSFAAKVTITAEFNNSKDTGRTGQLNWFIEPINGSKAIDVSSYCLEGQESRILTLLAKSPDGTPGTATKTCTITNPAVLNENSYYTYATFSYLEGETYYTYTGQKSKAFTLISPYSDIFKSTVRWLKDTTMGRTCDKNDAACLDGYFCYLTDSATTKFNTVGLMKAHVTGNADFGYVNSDQIDRGCLMTSSKELFQKLGTKSADTSVSECGVKCQVGSEVKQCSLTQKCNKGFLGLESQDCRDDSACVKKTVTIKMEYSGENSAAYINYDWTNGSKTLITDKWDKWVAAGRSLIVYDKSLKLNYPGKQVTSMRPELEYYDGYYSLYKLEDEHTYDIDLTAEKAAADAQFGSSYNPNAFSFTVGDFSTPCAKTFTCGSAGFCCGVPFSGASFTLKAGDSPTFSIDSGAKCVKKATVSGQNSENLEVVFDSDCIEKELLCNYDPNKDAAGDYPDYPGWYVERQTSNIVGENNLQYDTYESFYAAQEDAATKKLYCGFCDAYGKSDNNACEKLSIKSVDTNTCGGLCENAPGGRCAFDQRCMNATVCTFDQTCCSGTESCGNVTCSSGKVCEPDQINKSCACVSIPAVFVESTSISPAILGSNSTLTAVVKNNQSIDLERGSTKEKVEFGFVWYGPSEGGMAIAETPFFSDLAIGEEKTVTATWKVGEIPNGGAPYENQTGDFKLFARIKDQNGNYLTDQQAYTRFQIVNDTKMTIKSAESECGGTCNTGRCPNYAICALNEDTKEFGCKETDSCKYLKADLSYSINANKEFRISAKVSNNSNYRGQACSYESLVSVLGVINESGAWIKSMVGNDSTPFYIDYKSITSGQTISYTDPDAWNLTELCKGRDNFTYALFTGCGVTLSDGPGENLFSKEYDCTKLSIKSVEDDQKYPEVQNPKIIANGTEDGPSTGQFRVWADVNVNMPCNVFEHADTGATTPDNVAWCGSDLTFSPQVGQKSYLPVRKSGIAYSEPYDYTDFCGAGKSPSYKILYSYASNAESYDLGQVEGTVTCPPEYGTKLKTLSVDCTFDTVLGGGLHTVKNGDEELDDGGRATNFEFPGQEWLNEYAKIFKCNNGKMEFIRCFYQSMGVEIGQSRLFKYTRCPWWGGGVVGCKEVEYRAYCSDKGITIEETGK